MATKYYYLDGNVVVRHRRDTLIDRMSAREIELKDGTIITHPSLIERDTHFGMENDAKIQLVERRVCRYTATGIVRIPTPLERTRCRKPTVYYYVNGKVKTRLRTILERNTGREIEIRDGSIHIHPSVEDVNRDIRIREEIESQFIALGICHIVDGKLHYV